MKTLRYLMIPLIALTAGAAGAASLTLTPGTGTFIASGSAKAQQNTAFQVNLNLDATGAPGANPGGLFGGNVIVQFDNTLLQYQGFAFNPAVPALAFFDAPVVSTSGNTQTVTFGFENAPDGATVGTFSFTSIGPVGSLATIGLVDADDFSGSFASYVPTYQRFYPAFVDAQVNVVPLPAGIWLLGTAIGALGTLRRRSRPAAA
jgi:hypothetical protein